MATKKLPKDCLPSCETCVHGRFKPQEYDGECWVLPMEWVVLSEVAEAMPRPAVRDYSCQFYKRRSH